MTEPLFLEVDAEPERRTVVLSAWAIVIAVFAALAGHFLVRLIGLITNVAFYGRVVSDFAPPWAHNLGPLVILVPVVGGLIVGVMARWGSAAIRGHGIPEAMEQVLLNESRISPTVLVLKPLSAAISIGTGGPFGAEGPIIATGGALGSVLGQLLHISADERKVLLAAGAAAGMAAIFSAPVSAVLLAVELLLFEYRPRSLIPVSLAAATATGVRIAFEGMGPVFPMPQVASPTQLALVSYVLIGVLAGIAGVVITRLLFAVEDGFEHLPVHWMWWPAIGGLVVGAVGYFAPRTLGVGYENITDILNGKLVGTALGVLVVMKLISWLIALGSGTSGGTLAPVMTIGGGIGALAGGWLAAAAPGSGVDPRIAGLVGMAATFAGASHALLASVVFAFEVTRQPLGLLPLLAGCSAAYLVSLLTMEHSIMTEKLARRGTRVHRDYGVDWLSQVGVEEVATREVVTLHRARSVAEVREWLATEAAGATHQGFPVVDDIGELVGVLTRRDLLRQDVNPASPVGDLVQRAPYVVPDDATVRDAADLMSAMAVGRLPVVKRDAPREMIGIVTRSDLLAAHERRLAAGRRVTPLLGRKRRK
jgi:H+/Cl- antiporter ClcA/CBS domain-containing protein